MKRKIEEDAMVQSSPSAGGIVQGPKGISSTDVLGKCQFTKGKGVFGNGDFYIPKPVFKKPLKRIDGKMYIVDAEYTKANIDAIEDIDKKTLLDFVKKYDPNASVMLAIAYYVEKQVFILKFISKSTTKFIFADFDGKKFVQLDKKVMTKPQILQILKGAKGIDFKIVWGQI